METGARAWESGGIVTDLEDVEMDDLNHLSLLPVLLDGICSCPASHFPGRFSLYLTRHHAELTALQKKQRGWGMYITPAL